MCVDGELVEVAVCAMCASICVCLASSFNSLHLDNSMCNEVTTVYTCVLFYLPVYDIHIKHVTIVAIFSLKVM